MCGARSVFLCHHHIPPPPPPPRQAIQRNWKHKYAFTTAHMNMRVSFEKTYVCVLRSHVAYVASKKFPHTPRRAPAQNRKLNCWFTRKINFNLLFFGAKGHAADSIALLVLLIYTFSRRVRFLCVYVFGDIRLRKITATAAADSCFVQGNGEWKKRMKIMYINV